MSKERDYQPKVIKRLKQEFPGCIVMKNDSSYIQGIPDLTVLHGQRWATLEVKKSAKEAHQPNQDHYVRQMNGMSYSSFIYPENEEEVFNDLQRALQA